MRTLTTGSNNDLLMSGRSLTLSSDIEAVLLVARHCAQAILGEMIFAADQGMPYFETIWAGAPETAPFESAFRERIMQIEGVTGIDDFEAYQEADAVKYSATISTIYGTGSLNG